MVGRQDLISGEPNYREAGQGMERLWVLSRAGCRDSIMVEGPENPISGVPKEMYLISGIRHP